MEVRVIHVHVTYKVAGLGLRVFKHNKNKNPRHYILNTHALHFPKAWAQQNVLNLNITFKVALYQQRSCLAWKYGIPCARLRISLTNLSGWEYPIKKGIRFQNMFRWTWTEMFMSRMKSSAQYTDVQTKLHSIQEQNNFKTHVANVGFHNPVDHQATSRGKVAQWLIGSSN